MQQRTGTVNKYYWLFPAVVGVLGVILDLYITRQGAGITGDGVWYIQGARHLLTGNGYSIQRADGFIPITVFPPFYSMLLAFFGIFGGSLYQIGRIVNMLIFGFNIFMVGWLIFRMNRSVVMSMVGSSFLLLSRDLEQIHAWIFTEPIFLFLFLICLIGFVLYLETGRLRYVLLVGAAAGFAIITRYAGIALLVTSCLGVAVLRKEKWSRRIRDAAIVGIIGIVPTIIWFIRNALLNIPVSGREELVFQMPPREAFVAFFSIIWQWIFPQSFGQGLGMRAALLVVAFLFLAGAPVYYLVFVQGRLDRERHSTYPRFLIFISIFSIIYLAVVFSSISFSILGGPLAYVSQFYRYLSPIFILFVLWTTMGLYDWYRIEHKRVFLRSIPVLAILFLLIVAVLQFNIFRKPIYLG
jgi:hypothetical protein